MERTPDRIHDEWLVMRSQDGEGEAFADLVRRRNAVSREVKRLEFQVARLVTKRDRS